MTSLSLIRIYAIVIRHLFMWRRNLDRVVDSFWWASIDLIFWGLTSSYLKNAHIIGGEIVPLFLGGIIFWTAIQNSQREINMPLLDEAWNRNLVNVFTTPIQISEFVIATIFLGMTKLLATLAVMSTFAYIMYAFQIFQFGWYILPAFASLILVGWWIGFIINGLIFRYGYKVEAFAWSLVFVIYPFSAVLYPVDSLPQWAQFISRLLPTSYIFENMRSILFSGTFSAAELSISFLLNILYLSLAILFMKKQFAHAKNSGRLIRLN